MKKDLKQVKEFHKVFNHPIVDTPQIPDDKRCELRVNLLQEELNELIDGINNRDIVEIADALADLQYVLNGAVLEFGLGDKFEALCDEVHRSNVSKTYRNAIEAAKGKAYHEERTMQQVDIARSDNVYITLRHSDGKVLKNPNYSEADLKTIVES